MLHDGTRLCSALSKRAIGKVAILFGGWGGVLSVPYIFWSCFVDCFVFIPGFPGYVY